MPGGRSTAARPSRYDAKSTPASGSSRSPSDPVADKIRALQAYTEDDRDSCVNIHVEPGAIVNVRASKPDSDAPLSVRSREWKKLAVRVVGALLGLATVVKAIWEATR